MKPVLLEDWATGHHMFDPPGQICLFGVVKGHPKIDDGKEVATSYIQHIDLIKMEAQTQFTLYKLGKRSKRVLEKYLAIEKSVKELHNGYEDKQFDGQPDGEIPPVKDG
jgi:hypothetical protein